MYALCNGQTLDILDFTKICSLKSCCCRFEDIFCLISCLLLCPQQDFFDSWVHLGTEKSEFVRGMGNANWLQEHRKNGYASFCAFAMAVVADRSIALEKKTVYATVELSGTLARGMMVVDWTRKLGCEMNVDLVRSLDLGKIQSLLIGMVEEAEAMEIYTV